MAAADVAETNAMLRAFVRDVRASGLLDGQGNGAFLYSCNEHVAGLSLSEKAQRSQAADTWGEVVYVRVECRVTGGQYKSGDGTVTKEEFKSGLAGGGIKVGA